MGLTRAFTSRNPQNFSLKKFLIFFSKKNPLWKNFYNFLIFSQKKVFLYFSKMELLMFQEGTFWALKIQRIYIFQEMEVFSFIFFLYFGKWNFPAPAVKFLIFFPKKFHSEKFSYIFSKKSFSYMSGKWNSYVLGNETFQLQLKKILGRNFLSSKN